MKLSKNFSLEELTVTKSGLPNKPNLEQVGRLTDLCVNVLQPLRELYGNSITVNSGFRSDAVNHAIGGAATSQHCKGEAADCDCADNAKLFRIIREHLTFDQLIWEGGDNMQPAWVHVSFHKEHNRGEVLRMTKVNGKSTYQKI